MRQDSHQRATERYAEAQDALRDQHARMLEDLRFSNPADPQQWPDDVSKARKGRPSLTFDRTNQFLMQVVNDARQNKPSIKCLPADSGADITVAEKLDGMVRHIEYVSRAGIAYDTAIDHAARVGLGWLRVVPEVMRPETNEQEIRIMRVHDPLAVCLDPNSTQPDGSDAMWGFVETLMSDRAFEAAYPKATPVSMDGGRWHGTNGVKLCEYFEVVEREQNRIVAIVEGQQVVMSEDEYWRVAESTGMRPQYIAQTAVKVREVKWHKMTGAEMLDETDFPSQFLPLIPVIGDEVWIEGERYLCGMVRKMMDSQRFHNYTLSQLAETIALQPKAPFIGAKEAFEGNEAQWARANAGTDAYLAYNHVDADGNPLPKPERQQPAVMSQGWAELLQYSTSAMESSVGMFKANLGQQGNETSGRAIRARQMEGDTANFHYIDNMSRSIEQLGRVIVDMIPRIYTEQRQARILGEDGAQDFVKIDPKMPQAVARTPAGKVVAINPGVGAYDVRVTVGPSYTSVREEAAQNIVEISQGNPQLGAALAPLLMKMRDMPEGDKAHKVALALLPPAVQKAYEGDEGEEMSPAHAAQMQAMQQQMQQLSQALENAAGEVERLEAEGKNQERELLIKAYQAETQRIQALNTGMSAEQVQVLVMQTLAQAMRNPDPLPPDLMQAPPDLPMEQPQEQPADAGFFSTEEGMQ